MGTAPRDGDHDGDSRDAKQNGDAGEDNREGHGTTLPAAAPVPRGEDAGRPISLNGPLRLEPHASPATVAHGALSDEVDICSVQAAMSFSRSPHSARMISIAASIR